MNKRCGKKTAYLDVKICEDWKDFNNFYTWFKAQVDNNWYSEGWEIDKDIIGRGKNIYSPDYCAFVPKAVNRLFVHAFNRKYKYFGTRGVTRLKPYLPDTEECTFLAEFSYEGKKVFSGEYDYEFFAFFDYKFAFEEFVQKKAEELKDNLNPKMYDALMSYRVLPSW